MHHRVNGAVQVAGSSAVGRVRTQNQDYIEWDAGLGLVVLADGMGGANAGEVASELAVKTIMGTAEHGIGQLHGGLEDRDAEQNLRRGTLILREALMRANETVFALSRREPRYRGMGTTAVTALFYDNRISVGYVGDSRLYRLRQGALHQMTEDHTMLQELVSRGLYSHEDARQLVSRNLLTRAIGVDERLAVDVIEDSVVTGDLYLFCSDGLTDMLSDAEIQSIVQREQGDLDKAARMLSETATDHGGVDNISVILARIVRAFPAPHGWYRRLRHGFF